MLDLLRAATTLQEKKRKAFGHDRSLTVGASEIGQCARRIWYTKKLGEKGYDENYSPPDGFGARGDLIEDGWTVPLIREAVTSQLKEKAPRIEYIWAGAGDQQTIVAHNWRLSATPDGLLTNAPRDTLAKYGVADLGLSDNDVVLELKSYDPRTNTKNLPKQVHVDQINAQMGLIQAAGKYKPKWGAIVYVNASDIAEILVFPVRFSPQQFDRQVLRAQQILGANDADQVRPEGKISGGLECDNCPFKSRCQGYAAIIPKKDTAVEFSWDLLKGRQRQDLRLALGMWINSKRQVLDLVRRMGVAESRIKEIMASIGVRKIESQIDHDGAPIDVEVTWNATKGRKTLDTKKAREFIEKHGGKLEDFERQGKDSEAIKIGYGYGAEVIWEGRKIGKARPDK